MSLDVSTDNEKAVHFYRKCGLELVEKYISEEKVEFAKFETPLENFIPFPGISHPGEEKKSESSSRNHNARSLAKSLRTWPPRCTTAAMPWRPQ